MKINIGLFKLILLTLFVAFFIGCKDIDIQSTWRNRIITIDGSDEEWKDLLMYHDKSKIAFASCNDDTYLYLIMVIGDRDEQRQIMRSGLTVYLDGTGGSDESFGVRFPLGMNGAPPMRSYDRSGRQNKMKEFSKDEEKEPSFAFKGTEMEIIGPNDNATNRMSISGGKGIQISVARSQDKLIYELKIALARTADEPYGIKATAGSTVGVGFVVNEIKREQNEMRGTPPDGGIGEGHPDGSMGDSPPGGDMGGGPSGEGRHGRRFGHGSNQQESQGTVDIWANLRLATPTTVPE